MKSSSGGLQRLELPGEAPSLAEAQAAVAQAFHLPSDGEEIILSFNNKVRRRHQARGASGGPAPPPHGVLLRAPVAPKRPAPCPPHPRTPSWEHPAPH